MRYLSSLTIACVAGISAFAQSPGSSGVGPGNGGSASPGFVPTLTLKIPNETVPPGGVAQMKFMKTEPTPISSGRPHGVFDVAIFDDVLGIQLFNPIGDMNGVALLDGPSMSIDFISNGAMQGTDYPVMTIALHARPTAVIGSLTQFALDPSSTFAVNGLPAFVKPIPPATVTVGGSLSIVNVVPGGGWLPAGSVVKVQGLGFQPRTQVQLSGVQAKSIVFVSPVEIDITLAQAADMTGKKIQVVNPDGAQDTYFSYLRGINLGVSNWPLLSNALPIFSSVTHSLAAFTSMAPKLVTQFAGLAIQNPSLASANVRVSLFSVAYGLLGSSTIPVPSGYRLMREISELTGVTAVPGAYAVVTSDEPIQVFGFLADQAARTITPFAAVVALP